MNTIIQAILSLLAAAGLLALAWLLFGRLLAPVGGGPGGPVYAVIPAHGDGGTLEHNVSGLLWLKDGAVAELTVIIADSGLDEQGYAIAEALVRRKPDVVLCPMDQLAEYLKTE